MGNHWGTALWWALVELGDRLAAIVPSLLVMLVLVALGLITGWLAKVLVTRGARAVGFDRHVERWGLAPSLRRSGMLKTPADSLGAIAFWTLFVLFASLGVDAIGLRGSTGATAFLLAFLPPLFAAVLILIVGVVVANFLSQGVLIAAVNARLPEARLLARASQWGIIMFAAATALTHLGIAKEMVLVAFGITFGGLVFALALAFGLGGRSIAHEILARRLHREPHEPQTQTQERLTHL